MLTGYEAGLHGQAGPANGVEGFSEPRQTPKLSPGGRRRRGHSNTPFVATISQGRLFFVDALRVAAVAFVIAHHAAQAYGPAGGFWPVHDQAQKDWFEPFHAANAALERTMGSLAATPENAETVTNPWMSVRIFPEADKRVWGEAVQVGLRLSADRIALGRAPALLLVADFLSSRSISTKARRPAVMCR
jgi:hypothetical protein